MMLALLIAFATFPVGFGLGKVFSKKSVRTSITRLLFTGVTLCALIWVSISYAIAIYSTVVLEQVYTMGELSEPAITTLLGAIMMKVLENIFEHNEGAIFGRNYNKEELS